ncbi:hypothetical protein CXB40_13230 [Pseudomonas syringae pv. avii]|uniref:hypothetical protein n=1 Tax=Pseudomonas syringae TaxID=317 RepID=UPI000CDB2031|nr:hypothetical protein [Pseudomonas syringae]POQ07739.1 hypothetical protein CXB40_13230 [Pseudomonas syringae pv. avii]
MTQAKERPILFSAPMVRAILEGRKTVTRRAVKKPAALDCLAAGFEPAFLALPGNADLCPYGKVGDRLWVRETWSDVNLQGAPGIAYRADGDVRGLMEDASFLDEDGAFNYDDPRSKPYQFACWSEDLIGGKEGRWRPSIHIPRWASRILLEISAVRVERLQEISRSDIRAEGLECPPELASDDVSPNYRDWYPAAWRELWESINGADSWNSNPWVWVVEFKQVTQ